MATLVDGRWGKISSTWELPCGRRVEVCAISDPTDGAGWGAPEWRSVRLWGRGWAGVLDPLTADLAPEHPCYHLACAVLDRRAPVEAIVDALAELGELAL